MEPASPTLPDKNQLTAKVSRVPKVRQLIALRTDRECVSPPMNKITLVLSNRLSNSIISRRPAVTHAAVPLAGPLAILAEGSGAVVAATVSDDPVRGSTPPRGEPLL